MRTQRAFESSCRRDAWHVFTRAAAILLATATAALAAGPAGTTNNPAIPAAGSYQIRNQKFGQLLRPKDANNADGVGIVLYPAQAWKCMTWKLAPVGEAGFTVQNHFTSKTFAADTKSDQEQPRVTQVRFAGAEKDRPAWRFQALPDGNWKIADAQSGKVLTATKAPNAYSAHIELAPWRDDDSQKWKLEAIDPKDLTM